MPVSTRFTLPASQVQKGDNLAFNNAVDEVTDVRRATKFVYLSQGSTTKPVRLELTQDVVVYRDVPTAEEVKAKRYGIAIEGFEWVARMAATAKEKATAELQSAIDKRGTISAHEFDAYARACAMDNLWKRVAAFVEAKDMTILEAARVVAARLREDILSGYNDPTYSGGFTFSNAERQLTTDVARRFLSDTACYVNDEEI